MTKLLKNGKQTVAFVIAFAIIAMSLFTGAVINSEATVSSKTVVYLTASNKEPDGTFMNGSSGSGIETDPYIISTPGQLRYIVQESTTASTKGKFYKVDPTIGTMVLQYESYINAVAGSLEGFLALDAEGTKTALSNTADRQQWQSGTKASGYDGFAGTIDFSGVTICGMYNANGGLFAVAREATIKNLIVSNNYITSGWYNGNVIGMVSCANATEYTKLTLNNIVVKNCYQTTTGNGYANTGVLIGTMMSAKNVCLDIRNILTYGNISKGTNSSSDSTLKDCALYGFLATSWNGLLDGIKNAYFEDIVTLDCVPYPTANVNNQMTRPEYWHDSIYTTHYNAGYKPNSWAELSAIPAIKQISASDAVGAAAITAMPDLGWENDWFATQGGMPALRALHGNLTLVKEHDKHYYECADCGITTVFEEHTWNVNTCTVCGYVCLHNGTGDQVIENRDATCVDPQGTYTYCRNCEWTQTDTYGTVGGHQLTWVDEVPANCQSTGVKGYWHCTECGGNYVGETEEEAKWAAMDSSITDPQVSLVIPIAPHNAHDLENGTILVRSDETGHWYLCYTCDGRLEAVVSDELAPEDKVVKHRFADSVCTECGWKCEEHDYVPTGNVLTVGSCTEDRVEEVKCKICGNKDSLTTPAKHEIIYCGEVAATDKLEGTKAHYECSVCKEIYADAAGTTKISKAELVIPKVLPAGYENTVIGGGNGNINTDTGNKSPATGENIALAVLSIVALSGVVFVITRKARKA